VILKTFIFQKKTKMQIKLKKNI